MIIKMKINKCAAVESPQVLSIFIPWFSAFSDRATLAISNPEGRGWVGWRWGEGAGAGTLLSKKGMCVLPEARHLYPFPDKIETPFQIKERPLQTHNICSFAQSVYFIRIYLDIINIQCQKNHTISSLIKVDTFCFNFYQI